MHFHCTLVLRGITKVTPASPMGEKYTPKPSNNRGCASALHH